MQAIRTRYHCTTNTKPSRISAKCEAGEIFVSYDHRLNADGNHRRAMLKLFRKLGWDADHYADMLPGDFAGDTYWVFDDKRLKTIKAYAARQRQGTMSGSPWGYDEHRALIDCIGRSYGFYGSALEAPCDDAAAARMADKLDPNVYQPKD